MNNDGVSQSIDVALGLDGAVPAGPADWWRLVDQIVQIEELISELQQETDGSSAALRRDLRRLLKEKRVLLKSIDVCC
jgi:hypothetical protein